MTQKPKVKPQTLFLRAISYRAETYSPEGANRVLLMALDELERAMLDPRSVVRILKYFSEVHVCCSLHMSAR